MDSQQHLQCSSKQEWKEIMSNKATPLNMLRSMFNLPPATPSLLPTTMDTTTYENLNHLISPNPPQISTSPPQISTSPPQISTSPPHISTSPPHISTSPPHISTSPPQKSLKTKTSKSEEVPSNCLLARILGDLYRNDERVRRQDPEYAYKASKLFDLPIVMPISIPYGNIVVDSLSGQNYYEFDKGHPGAQLLFGRPQRSNGDCNKSKVSKASNESQANVDENNDALDGSGNVSHIPVAEPSHIPADEPSHIPADVPIPSVDTITDEQKKNKKTTKPEKLRVGGGTNGVNIRSTNVANGGPVCDMWASFLHIKLGTIYNVNLHSIPIICEMFERAFDVSNCTYYVPITADFRGLFKAEAKQKTGGPRAQFAPQGYETRGKLVSENDRSRFRMIRRYLKKFARDVMLCFSGLTSIFNKYEPRIRVELHPNCKSSSLSGGISTLVHEWTEMPKYIERLIKVSPVSRSHTGTVTPVSAPYSINQLSLDMVDQGCSTLSIHDFSARVELGEIRIERQRLRMVDQRWPNDLVMGRRIADTMPQNGVAIAGSLQARFVFCDCIKQPQVVYRISKRQFETVLKGPTLEIISAHVEAFPESEEQFSLIAQNDSWPEDETEVKCVVGSKAKSMKDTMPKGLDMSNGYGFAANYLFPRNDGSHFTDCGQFHAGVNYNSPLSTTTTASPGTGRAKGAAPCRYFQLSGCARGDSCYYLHSAYPKLEYPVDIREVREIQHPKFF